MIKSWVKARVHVRACVCATDAARRSEGRAEHRYVHAPQGSHACSGACRRNAPTCQVLPLATATRLLLEATTRLSFKPATPLSLRTATRLSLKPCFIRI